MRTMCRIVYVAFVCIILFAFTACSSISGLDSFSANDPEYINYNNYNQSSDYFSGSMDYRNGTLVYNTNAYAELAPVIVSVNEDGENQILEKVSAPFQLTENGIVYVNDSSLYYQYGENSNVLITEYVRRFITWKGYVIYTISSVNGKKYPTLEDHQKMNTLYIFDLQTNETAPLQENVSSFGVYNDCVYTITFSDDILHRISLDTFSVQAIGEIPTNDLFDAQFSDDYMISNWYDRSFVLTDLESLQRCALPFAEEPNQEADVCFICEGDTIYYSYSASIRDGSVLYPDFDHPQNGTWRLNIHTGEQERITNSFFMELYCFDKTHLYGVNLLGSICEIKID